MKNWIIKKVSDHPYQIEVTPSGTIYSRLHDGSMVRLDKKAKRLGTRRYK